MGPSQGHTIAKSRRHARFDVEDQSDCDKERGHVNSPPPLTEADDPRRPQRTRGVQRCRKGFAAAYGWALGWADPHLRSLRDLKIIARCTIALEACLIMMLARDSRGFTSTSKVFEASYLIPLMAFYLPPCDSLSVYLEKTVVAAIMMATAWAYDCFVIWLAYLARPEAHRYADTDAFVTHLRELGYDSMADAQPHIYIDVQYIESQSAAVTIILLAVGLGTLAWFRGQMLTACPPALVGTAIYLPFPYFAVGLPPFSAFGYASLFNLFVALFIFPESSNHRFLDLLNDTVAPLRHIISSQNRILTTSPSTESWSSFKSLNDDYWKATNSLYALEKTENLIKTEVSFRRLGPRETSHLLLNARKVSTAASGFLRFQMLVSRHLSVPIESESPTLDDFTLHITPSQPASRMATPPTSPHRSRYPSAASEHDEEVPQPSPRISLPAVPPVEALYALHSTSTPTSEAPSRIEEEPESTPPISTRRNTSFNHRGGASSGNASQLAPIFAQLMSSSLHRRPVGVYMSSRYAQLENLLSRPDDAQTLQDLVDMLHEQCSDLIVSLDEGLEQIVRAIQLLKSSSPIKAFQGRARITVEVLAAASKAQDRIEECLSNFNAQRGAALVAPFAHAFESQSPATKPSARTMFWSLLYQHSMQKTAEQVLELLSTVRRFESENQKSQLYWPSLSILLRTSRFEIDTYEEDPAFIGGLREPKTHRQTPRDPDRLPPRTIFQYIASKAYKWLSYIGCPARVGPPALFLYKTAVLQGLLLLPMAFPSVSGRYYRYRAVWAPILSTMTSSQHLGETLHGFVYRLLGSLGGALFGFITWEIGSRNPWVGFPEDDLVFANITAVQCILGFFCGSFIRVFHPEQALVIIALTTYAIVLGYSWQNYQYPNVMQVSYGFKLAVTRFVLSAVGLAATFIWAFLPPASTQKASVRKTYARTLTELGFVLCDTLTHANSAKPGAKVPGSLFQNLTAIRAKLHAVLRRRNFIAYEFAIRGNWPKDQWIAVAETQLELVDWIEQLLEVLNLMSEPYKAALLARSKLGNPKFVGRIMSAMHAMSLSLQLGLPIPALYTPLLEDMGLENEFDVEDGSSSPFTLNATILGSQEYMSYAVASTAIFCIINRLDRLMFCTKSLVGESFRVDGIAPVDDEEAGEEQDPLLYQNRTSHVHTHRPGVSSDYETPITVTVP